MHSVTASVKGSALRGVGLDSIARSLGGTLLWGDLG